MRSYFTLFSLSIILSFLITPIIRRKALIWGAVAVPDTGRHIHRQPTPRLGGVAIFISFILTLLLVPFLGNLVTDIFNANLTKLLGLLLPATLIFLFGIYDDFRGATAPLKVIFQLIATALIFYAGYRIENISSPFGGYWHLPIILSFPLTALWIVGITNAFNLIDGIDGLAAGASVFALLSILIFSIAQGNPEISIISLILVGAVIGFLRYNFNPATIFLGDSGSLFLGFMAASLSLAGSQKGSTLVAIAIPLVSFGLPVMEVGLSLIRRFVSGQPLLAGDSGHIHHRLLQLGLNQRQAVILLYAVCAMFSLFGLMLLNPQRNIAALIFFVLGAGVVFGVQHLRYAEFSELGSQIMQGVTRRRRSLAVNVRVRRTSDDLSKAETPEHFFQALDEMLSTNEFDCALLDMSTPSPVFESHALRCRSRLAGLLDGNYVWIWDRDETPLEEIIHSDQYWTLRVPLSEEQGLLLGHITFYRKILHRAPTVDIGHLCGSLQRELSSAISRMSDQLAVR